ncbi:hypothetical protein SAMN05428982_0146 [Pseudoxanthomonas sp. CF385]|uniref:vanadium-dependent haloperoxidase n=1 Tax=Pseudoxanthomonas sp. CF385 TaxID=1881042 RepID=UPI0008849820|nr:vanadium-dependent haloperoxidase [Pseudoxanthomonas sp. CF385]SDQ22003.1 hypothetical protein SAMN05428982_0146 [Pseudoxanthomonas sp. CF385]
MNLISTAARRVFARRRRSVLLIAALVPGLAQADAVIDWNTTAWQAATAAGGPPIQTRINTITHLAIHDALNSIELRYEPYAGTHPAARGASPDAAIATAAYMTLSITVPSQAAALETTYDTYLAGLTCPAAFPGCVSDGIAVGAAAAEAILALRANDGAATPHAPYSAPLLPGVYQPTAPNFAAPQFGNWGRVKPFALNRVSQFAAGPSPLMNLRSGTYRRDYQEVMAVGSAAVRGAPENVDSYESRAARYWAGGGANANAIAQRVVAGRGLDRWQHARLFALMNMAQADASFGLFYGKYQYAFWRPITAIHASGNTQWMSYLVSPPYPDYASGLSGLTASAMEVMRRLLGTDALPYTYTAAGIERHFDTLSQAENEAAMSRVYAGIHFRSACTDGLKQGTKVGNYVVRHYLRPRRR